MDCSYCILQAYFHPPVLQYFAGLETLAYNLEKIFSQNKIFRIGTGEYTDSLIWEKISLQPKFLIETFAKQNNCLLELKTKTVNIDSLLPLDHNGKTVIAWSLNTPDIIRSEEKDTASLKARLEAARRVESKGYQLAFHFDPMVIYPECEIQYKKVIQQIFEYVRPESIVWISIGTFRFMPKLKQTIEKRFKDSTICYGEFILGLDNKMRYFKPLRIQLYKQIISCIKEYAPDLLVYFCMEDEEVWEKCMGFFPEKEGELGHYLDKSAAEHCSLNSSFL
jgi:spore photoproduct lyase